MRKTSLLFAVAIFDILLAQTNIDSGLVVYLPFDGDTRDYSGRKNHALAFGVIWHPNRFGNTGRAAYLKANGGMIIPFTSDFDFSETRAFSVGYWTNSNSVGFSNHPSDFDCLGCFQFAIYPDESHPEKTWVTVMGSHCWIFLRSGNTNLIGWHHYFVTLNDKQIHLYIDGKNIDTQAPYNLRWRLASLHHLEIGLLPGKNGSIDELRMYNRKLTSDEILYLFNLRK